MPTTAGHQQQQDASNSWDASYNRNNRNCISMGVVLATGLTEQKQQQSCINSGYTSNRWDKECLQIQAHIKI
jgi:hypothetical protein